MISLFFAHAISDDPDVIYYNELSLKKGDVHEFTQKTSVSAYLLIHTFSKATIEVTYLRHYSYIQAFSVVYDSSNLTQPFFDFGYYVPKITITANDDTKIIYAMYYINGCGSKDTIFAGNKNFYVPYYAYKSQIGYQAKCIFGCFGEEANITLTSYAKSSLSKARFYYFNISGQQADILHYDKVEKKYYDKAFISAVSTGDTSSGYFYVDVANAKTSPMPAYANETKLFDNKNPHGSVPLPPWYNDQTQGSSSSSSSSNTTSSSSGSIGNGGLIAIFCVIGAVLGGACIGYMIYYVRNQ